jgi:hypothetical protein
VALGEVDGRAVAVTGAWDGSVRLWRLTGRTLTPSDYTLHIDSFVAVVDIHRREIVAWCESGVVRLILTL